jgi:hypothetical protein
MVNGSIMNNYIGRELERLFQKTKAAHVADVDGMHGKAKAVKSVTTLALEAYMAETPEMDILHNERLDERFAYYATCQIRLFLFAGTDTTATVLANVYHMLAKHPEWLRKMRVEHYEVFGQDPDVVAGVLTGSPSLLNNCKFTVALIKEVLRIYGPAGTMRSGLPGLTVSDNPGDEQPMEYAGANTLHQALHVNSRVWPRANGFLPERFLTGPEDDLHPDPAAYRPFEQGPRNCIGQTLV